MSTDLNWVIYEAEREACWQARPAYIPPRLMAQVVECSLHPVSAIELIAISNPSISREDLKVIFFHSLVPFMATGHEEYLAGVRYAISCENDRSFSEFMYFFKAYGDDWVSKFGFNMCRGYDGEVLQGRMMDELVSHVGTREVLITNACLHSDAEALLEILGRQEVWRTHSLSGVIGQASQLGATLDCITKLVGGDVRAQMANLAALRLNLQSDKTEAIEPSYLTPTVVKFPHEVARMVPGSKPADIKQLKKFASVVQYIHEKGGDVYLAYRVIRLGEYGFVDAIGRVANPSAELDEMLKFIAGEKQDITYGSAFLGCFGNEALQAHPDGERLLQKKYQVFGGKDTFRMIKSAAFKTRQAGAALSL
ncbi:hypothetical protein ACYPKM_05440 [Pseudomonas aeruginosa]